MIGRRALARFRPLLAGAALGLTSLLALGAAVPGATTPERRSIRYLGRTMGTYVEVLLVGSDSAAASPLAHRALDVFARVDSLMSNWTEISEVARLNREGATGARDVDPEVGRVIQLSLETWQRSEGAFDITVEPLVRAWGFLGGHPHVPSAEEARVAFRKVGSAQVHYDPGGRTLRFDREGVRIDLGGIAKGYAVDAAAETLAARGVKDALVDLSGNMRALGAPANSRYWRIGIRDPRDRVPFFARLPLSGQGISTSGKYEQFVAQDGRTYGHIMDPRAGRPAEGLISVTVLAPSALLSDTWDTPLFVLGLEGAKRVARQRKDLSVVLVTPGDGGVDTVWVESSLRDRFRLEPGARSFFRVLYF